ncbi:hypothetical protein Hanom_Chr06g00489161 [Helianthus anomalus]
MKLVIFALICVYRTGRNTTPNRIVPDRTEMNLPPSEPNSHPLANCEPEPRTRTGANRELGDYGYNIYRDKPARGRDTKTLSIIRR